MPIRSFRHKGLKRLFEDDDARALSAGSVDKLRKMLFALDSAVSVAEIGAMPGWRLHRLKGELVSMWSLTVTRNWRLVFRFEAGDAFEVDLKEDLECP
jgi:toxin HigB-1